MPRMVGFGFLHPKPSMITIRATPALLVARGTGQEKGPDDRGMGLQRMRARGTGQTRATGPAGIASLRAV